MNHSSSRLFLPFLMDLALKQLQTSIRISVNDYTTTGSSVTKPNALHFEDVVVNVALQRP